MSVKTFAGNAPFEFKTSIVRQIEGPGRFVSVVRWIGGFRFQEFGTLDEARDFHKRAIHEITMNYEVIE